MHSSTDTAQAAEDILHIKLYLYHFYNGTLRNNMWSGHLIANAKRHIIKTVFTNAINQSKLTSATAVRTHSAATANTSYKRLFVLSS